MNILYFVHGYPPSIGAAAINTYKIVEYLSNLGHKFLILSPGVFSKISDSEYTNNSYNPNVDVRYSSKYIQIPFNLIFSHFENLLKYIIKLKRSFKPDLILSQYHAYHYASVVGGYLSNILKIPHIIRSHDIFFLTENFSLPFRFFHTVIYTNIYHSIKNCDLFYVTTTEMKRHFLKYDKLKNINLKVQHNGIDTTQFYPYKNQEVLKDKYGCENIILFVGQISKDYDLRYIINALPEILKKHKDTHFLIIGSGPYKANLLKFLRNHQLFHQVHFLGIKPHQYIPFYINNCDFGIGRITYNTIWRYMIPVKCLEYMACGKTFISAPISRDLIKENDVGLLINRNFTQNDITEKINILIEDKTLRNKLGQNGLKKINEQFNWQDIMSRFNEELIKTKSSYLRRSY